MMNIINTKPDLFQRTEACIWTDPYIQANLLKAYLDLSSDAASRNMKSIERTVDFIDNNIKKGGDILDLGCGPGLYTDLFWKKGYRVAGIDFNKKAIEYAIQETSPDIKYIEGDYITNFPMGKYDAIIMIYCDMGTHSDEDRDVLLSNCYESLEEGEKLIFDVFNENLITDKKEILSWDYQPDGGFWAHEEYLLLSQIFHYPENCAIASQYNLIQKDKVKHFVIWDRYYKEDEIAMILKNIGFSKVGFEHGLLADNDFTSTNAMFVIAEK